MICVFCMDGWLCIASIQNQVVGVWFVSICMDGWLCIASIQNQVVRVWFVSICMDAWVLHPVDSLFRSNIDLQNTYR